MFVEIKGRVENDGLSWEERPILVKINLNFTKDGGHAVKCMTSIAKKMIGGNLREIRWNWENSPQGHYIFIK